MEKEKKRCFGEGAGQSLLAHYHDHEWGTPVHDDRHHFEMLINKDNKIDRVWAVVTPYYS